jgi:hypothetical protein
MAPHRDADEVGQFPFKQHLIVPRRTGKFLMSGASAEPSKKSGSKCKNVILHLTTPLLALGIPDAQGCEVGET